MTDEERLKKIDGLIETAKEHLRWMSINDTNTRIFVNLTDAHANVAEALSDI